MIKKSITRAICIAVCLVSAAGFASRANAVPTLTTYYLTTGQTGAQTQIDLNHTATWSFTATSSWLLGGGNFTMKDGSNSTANVVFSVYNGTDTTGSLLGRVDYTNSQFCSDQIGNNCQSFGSTPFHFATSVNITSNLNYFIELTSTAVDAQSDAYFIKGVPASTIVDSQNNVLAQSLGNANIPEPASLALIGTGLIAMCLTRKVRAARAK
jgi:hypothetical protein